MADFDPIYLNLSDDPRQIVRKMDEFRQSRLNVEQRNQRRKKIPPVLFLAGFGLVAFDLLIFWLLLGYQVCLFTPVAVVCWIAAIVMWIVLRKANLRKLPAGFDKARQVIHTLRDDIKSGSSFAGHVDLTGLEQPSKIARETKDLLGRTNRLYRDQWLNLKLKMYDGNILRISTINRSKTRMGYWKRGQISGKMKWKPEKFKGSLTEMKVRLAVNPAAYEISLRPELAPGMSVGPFRIESANGIGGILTILASGTEPTAEEILQFLHMIYQSLKRKVTV